jgi:hypothetical protein
VKPFGAHGENLKEWFRDTNTRAWMRRLDATGRPKRRVPDLNEHRWHPTHLQDWAPHEVLERHNERLPLFPAPLDFHQFQGVLDEVDQLGCLQFIAATECRDIRTSLQAHMRTALG